MLVLAPQAFSADSVFACQSFGMTQLLVGTVQEKLEVDLEVKVLTTGFWPTYAAAELSLPAEMGRLRLVLPDLLLRDHQEPQAPLGPQPGVRAACRDFHTPKQATSPFVASTNTRPLSAAMLQTVLREPADSGTRRSTAQRKTFTRWSNHAQGHVNVAATFKGKKKEFVLHPFQAALLMLFNDADDISVADMLERLNLGEEDVVRTVSSLAHAKAPDH